MDDAFIFLFSNAFIYLILASLEKTPAGILMSTSRAKLNPKTNLSVSLH